MRLLNNPEVVTYAGTIDNCIDSIKTCREIISKIEDHPLSRTKVITVISNRDNKIIEKDIPPEIAIQLYNLIIDEYKSTINDCNKKLHSLIDKCSREEN